MPDVACLGLLIADVFGAPLAALPAEGELALIDQYLVTVGGCAANTAVDLVRLGRSARVLGKIGDDHFGDFVMKELRRRGVDPSFVSRSSAHPTSFTYIMNVRGQDRRYIHCSGANAHFTLADIDAKALDGARALHIGGFFALPSFDAEQLARLFRDARSRGLMTLLDVVIPAGTKPSLESLREVLALSDAFFPNHDEGRVLTGSENPLEQAEIFAAMNPACTIVITMGRAGAIARRGKQTLRADAYKVPSIDESGGGDAFDAGFIVGQLAGWPLEDTLRFASAAGASCTRALGCHEGVFTFDEAKDFVARNPLEIVPVST
jgi:sugar/nucleoside kinase (ribokinase family)